MSERVIFIEMGQAPQARSRDTETTSLHVSISCGSDTHFANVTRFQIKITEAAYSSFRQGTGMVQLHWRNDLHHAQKLLVAAASRQRDLLSHPVSSANSLAVPSIRLKLIQRLQDYDWRNGESHDIESRAEATIRAVLADWPVLQGLHDRVRSSGGAWRDNACADEQLVDRSWPSRRALLQHNRTSDARELCQALPANLSMQRRSSASTL